MNLSTTADGGPFQHRKVTPVARRAANQLGVELATVVGSGARGRVLKSDVERSAGRENHPAEPTADITFVRRAAPSNHAVAQDALLGEAPTAGQQHTLTRLQQTVARRMAESNATVPDFTLFVEVDFEACVSLRERLRRLSPDAVPSYNDIIIKAAAVALREYPRANGSYREAAFDLHPRVNVGFAVAAKDALLVPVVADADRRSLSEIATETRRLAAAAREGRLTPPDMAGGTFTVSNLGMFGIDRFVAIVNPPQAGILTVGALAKRPAVHDGQLCIRTVVTLGLVCDHRILYGADASMFLARVRALLEHPLSIAL